MKTVKLSKQIMPSAREIVLASEPTKKVSRKRTIIIVEIKSRSGSSLVTVSLLMRIGCIRAAIPMSSKIFKMLLPMTLPRSISVVPLIRDEIETASSGAPVPKATMVSPIRSLLTLKCEAVEEAPSISQSAPLIRIAKPIISNTICKNISITFTFYFSTKTIFLLGLR